LWSQQHKKKGFALVAERDPTGAIKVDPMFALKEGITMAGRGEKEDPAEDFLNLG